MKTLIFLIALAIPAIAQTAPTPTPERFTTFAKHSSGVVVGIDYKSIINDEGVVMFDARLFIDAENYRESTFIVSCKHHAFAVIANVGLADGKPYADKVEGNSVDLFRAKEGDLLYNMINSVCGVKQELPKPTGKHAKDITMGFIRNSVFIGSGLFRLNN